MSFREDIPNYKTLHSEKYNLSSVDNSVWQKLEAYAQKVCKNVDDLICVTNKLSEIAIVPATTNWGWNFVIHDLSNVISSISKQVKDGKFYLFMDAIATIVEIGNLDLYEVDEFLTDFNIGYCLKQNPFTKKYYWVLRDEISDLSENIEMTQDLIKDGFKQAVEHFDQAKKQLMDAQNERARKDAVRDCASAMESIVKILGKDEDISIASKNLRNQNIWGKDIIVKDGNSIFNTLHRLYPDFRHGSTEMSTMSIEESQYWVDRITTYVNYMLRTKNNMSYE